MCTSLFNNYSDRENLHKDSYTLADEPRCKCEVSKDAKGRGNHSTHTSSQIVQGIRYSRPILPTDYRQDRKLLWSFIIHMWERIKAAPWTGTHSRTPEATNVARNQSAPCTNENALSSHKRIEGVLPCDTAIVDDAITAPSLRPFLWQDSASSDRNGSQHQWWNMRTGTQSYIHATQAVSQNSNFTESTCSFLFTIVQNLTQFVPRHTTGSWRATTRKSSYDKR